MLYTTPPSPPGVEIIASSEFDALLASPPPSALMTEHLRVLAGQGVVVYGGPGELKTYLTLAAVVRFALDGGRVLWLAGEGAKRALVSRISSLACGYGSSCADLGERFLLIAGGFNVLEDGANDFLEQATITHEPEIVVLDPMATFFVGDENAAGEVKALLHELDQWRSIGIAVLVIHHARKPSEGRRIDLRGSSAVRAWADSVVLVERPDMTTPTCRVTVQKARDEEPAPPTTVTFSFTDSNTTITPAAAIDKREREVLDALRRSGKPRTPTDLRKELRCNGARIAEALESLVARGLLKVVREKVSDRNGRVRALDCFALV
jgi:RecA-family ATPase